MYYVLKTHGEINNHWGYTATGMFASVKKARKHIKEQLAKDPTKDKYVIAKMQEAFHISDWKISEVSQKKVTIV